MTEKAPAEGWGHIREKRRLMLNRIGASLSPDERKVFARVLELNIAGRHQKSPRVRKPLYDYVTETIS